MNYGGILQTYALQQVLNQLGHDVVVLDRRNKASLSFVNILIKCKKLLCRYILGKPIYNYDDRKQEYYNVRYDVFVKFINNNIHISKPIYSTEGLTEAIRQYNLNAIIVGSDQVWRPICVPSIDDYFLGFLQDDETVAAIAYAASFGTSDWEYSLEQEFKFSKYIGRFDAVSVREKDAVWLCENHFNVSAEMVLDPTMLLDREFYLSICYSINKTKNPLPRNVSYVLDKSEYKCELMSKMSDLVEGDISAIPVHVDDGDFLSVPEWLFWISNANYVITDSFHGCVFSIIFNVPFIALSNDVRGQSRIRSLLDTFSLSDRLCVNSDHLESIVNKKIDWLDVNEKLMTLRLSSLSFLKNNLYEKIVK
jgi:hypothetical protein